MQERGLTDIREALLAWYVRERRDLPWRHTRDPYAVLVSEVMLQQTQASRIVERFPRFMARFPTAEALAAADAASVLREWSGLGYNRRALALRECAILVAAHGWPHDVAGLERLPGIGPYTARAIASLAFGQPVGVVDTNVRRWLTRRFGPRRPRELQALSDALAAAGAGRDAAAWTHATMEFGAQVCRSRSPRCASCPISVACLSVATRQHVAPRRQGGYRGSRRAYRGALVRLLAESDGRAVSRRAAAVRLGERSAEIGAPLDSEALDRIVASLVRDGLVTDGGAWLRLGSGRPIESISRPR